MKSIQAKLTITILAIFLVALSILGGLNYWKAREIITQSITNDMEKIAVNSAADIGDWLDARKAEMTIMTEAPFVQTGNREAIVPFLINVAKADKTYDGISYATMNGDYVNSLGVTGNVADREYFKKALTGEAAISDPLVSKSSGHLVTVAAVPVMVGGKVTGVLYGAVDMAGLTKKVLAIKAGNTGYACVIQGDGLTIIHPDKKVAMKTNSLTDSNIHPVLKATIERMVKREKGLTRYEFMGADKMMAFAPVAGVNWSLVVTVPSEEVTGTVSNLMWISLATIIVVLFLAAIIIAWYARRIAKPIQVLEAAASRIAGGDLTMSKMDITSNDEIGRLGRAFETMTQNLRELIKQVSSATGQVAASSEELTAGAQQSAAASNNIAISITQVAQGSEKQVSAVNETSAIVQEISATMEEMTATATEMATMSEQTASAAIEGKTSVDRAVGQMNAVSVGAKQAQVAAEELKASSAQIGEIVGLISTIAGQTNLLALNAAIEAARAGEQGRGFAVVAEEVRKLAEQSEQAAQQIKGLVGSNHDSIGKVVAAIDVAGRELTQGVELVNVAGTNFGAINEQVRKVTDQVRIIAKAINEAAIGSQRIVNSIKEVESVSRDSAAEAQTVSAATEEQSASMEEIAASSQSLAKLAIDLQAAVSKFRV
jgi:methyl-accepting chemotaxis protein